MTNSALGEEIQILQGEAVEPSEQVVFTARGIWTDGSAFEELRPQLSAEVMLSADDFTESPRREPQERDQVIRGGKVYDVYGIRRDDSIGKYVLELRYAAEAP